MYEKYIIYVKENEMLEIGNLFKKSNQMSGYNCVKWRFLKEYPSLILKN